MAKNTERVCYHLCAVIALLIMAGCCHVHVWLLKWVDFHTRTTFHKMPSADVFCWMNTFVTDCLICPLHCDWCEDKQILRHACFCFRVSFFWLSSDFYLRSDGISACLSLVSSDCLLISLAYPHYKSQVTQMSSTAVKGSPVNPPQPRIKSQTTTPSEGDRPEQSGHCNSLNLSDKIRLMIVV